MSQIKGVTFPKRMMQ